MTQPADDEKEFRTLQAAFALRGHTLHRAADKPGFYAARWGLVRELATADDARHFLAQIGGKQ